MHFLVGRSPWLSGGSRMHKYLQKVEKKGKNIMESEPNCCSDKDFKKVEKSQDKNTLVEENNNHHTGDDQIKIMRVM